MIRIFIGTSANGEDAESCAVLEYSIKKHTRRPVEITWMRLSKKSSSAFYSGDGEGWNTSQWATPFSGFRWAVPSLAWYEGRAIYMDSDVIVLSDIAGLFDQPMHGKMILAKSASRLCVSLWDCERAAGVIPPPVKWRENANHHREFGSMLRKQANLLGDFSGDWNNLDGEGVDDLENIDALHYTRMATQPHIPHARRRLSARGAEHWFDGEYAPHWRSDIVDLFDQYLDEAREAGYLAENYDPGDRFGSYSKKSMVNMRGAEKPRWASAKS